MSGPSKVGRNPDGTFAKGGVGNPAGKPKGTRHRTTLMAEKLMADAAGDVVNAMVAAAKSGDVQAGKIILDRIVPVRKGRPAPIDLPEVTTADGVLKALGEVVARMAGGELTPDEAATIAGVVMAPKGIIETQELERRIEALERRLARGERPPQEGGEPG